MLFLIFKHILLLMFRKHKRREETFENTRAYAEQRKVF